MARYDTTAFMAAVIRDAKIPAGSTYRTASTLLGLASDEMEALMVPELIKVTGGHLMAYKDYTLVSGRQRYRFPPRAIRPERLQVMSAEGKMVGKLYPADGALVDEVLANRSPPGDALGYWVAENNHAVIVFRNNNLTLPGMYLRIYYRRQPNRLAATSDCVKIVSYTPPDTVAGFIEFDKINAADSLATLTEDTPYDVIKSTPTFEASVEDCTFQSILTTSCETLEGITSISDVEAGDVIAPAGYTPVPQLPVALHPVLVAYTVARILREMGNQPGADAALAEAQRKLGTALTTVTPRSEEPETTVEDIWGV